MSYPNFTKEELEEIKKECAYWANNCGGCETCSQHFSDPPKYDHEETYRLVGMIESTRKDTVEDVIKFLHDFQDGDNGRSAMDYCINMIRKNFKV